MIIKKFNIKSYIKGYKNNKIYILYTNKNIKIGSINYKLKIFLNNKYILNKYLKLNINLSNIIYKSNLVKFNF